MGSGKATKTVDCPFCGQTRSRSKEHVWAQWLHDTPGAQYLINQSHGERIPIEHTSVSRAADGRLQRQLKISGQYAKYLTHVTVWVCSNCNSGWMSQLENEARRILKPFILDGKTFVVLGQNDLRLLATWAIKSWMAYSLTLSDIENPFTTKDDYGSIAQTSQPPDRCMVWLFHSLAEQAHVGIGLSSTFLEFLRDPAYTPADLAEVPNNFAFGFLSVASCVFFLVRTPEGMPEEGRQLLIPPQLTEFGSRQIWPSQRRQYFPLDVMPDMTFDQLLEFPRLLAEAIAMPTIGLSENERAEAVSQYLAGASPRELRRGIDTSAYDL